MPQTLKLKKEVETVTMKQKVNASDELAQLMNTVQNTIVPQK